MRDAGGACQHPHPLGCAQDAGGAGPLQACSTWLPAASRLRPPHALSAQLSYNKPPQNASSCVVLPLPLPRNAAPCGRHLHPASATATRAAARNARPAPPWQRSVRNYLYSNWIQRHAFRVHVAMAGFVVLVISLVRGGMQCKSCRASCREEQERDEFLPLLVCHERSVGGERGRLEQGRRAGCTCT